MSQPKGTWPTPFGSRLGGAPWRRDLRGNEIEGLEITTASPQSPRDVFGEDDEDIEVLVLKCDVSADEALSLLAHMYPKLEPLKSRLFLEGIFARQRDGRSGGAA